MGKLLVRKVIPPQEPVTPPEEQTPIPEAVPAVQAVEPPHKVKVLTVPPRRKKAAGPGEDSGPEDKEEKTRTCIDLGRGYTLTADAYSWCITKGSKSMYFPTLAQVLTYATNTEIRTANCKSLDKLLSVALGVQAWIRGMLSPLETWREQGIGLSPDLQMAVGTLVAALVEPDQSGKKSSRAKKKETVHEPETHEGRAGGDPVEEDVHHGEGLQEVP